MPSVKGHTKHLIFSVRGDFKCDACGDQCDKGLFCDNCEFSVHKKCTFVFSILEYEHLSHVGHCLKLLTTGAPDNTDPKCHLCGKNTTRLLYHCSICNLNLDIDCMLKDMAARASINMPWHHHPLVKLDMGYQMLCEVCGHPNGYGYFCPTCKLMVHDNCVSLFETPEITHPFHVRHSLKLLTEGAPEYTDRKCHVCGGNHTENFLYHCDICKFNLDMSCAIKDHRQHTVTPVVLSNMKVHEDTLTLIPRLNSFVCDACGRKGDRSPYVSLLGDHMFFHQKCVHLPRVIHVNRHDHRVSYKYSLGPGEWKCEICLEEIDWSCGAYSCSICPNYVFHSSCATRDDVWDGKELDGVPEGVEDSEPFKLNDDNTITHFTHEEHRMSLNKEGIALVETISCEACGRSIASNNFYKCSVCNFILHETCANLPKTLRHFLSPRPLSLRLNNVNTKCHACNQDCCKGFTYSDKGMNFDLVCCSITVPFIHGSHEHPLLYVQKDGGGKSCQHCGNIAKVIGCIKCNYYLDFCCATLPSTIRLQRYDDHPLTLCYGEEASGKYWCDICERETNPKDWFYTCNDCSVTLHTFCVLGDMIRYAKPGGKILNRVTMRFNDSSSRPICTTCHSRCVGPFVLRYYGIEVYCSCYCFYGRYSGSIVNELTSPPWIDELNTRRRHFIY